MECIPNLQKVLVEYHTRCADIQALLQFPKCFLRNIELNFYDKTEVKKAMDAFGEGWVTSLESVDICCPFPPAKTFDMLTNRNISMRGVHIYLKDLREEGVMKRA